MGRLRSLLRLFARDRRGVSAVEFALIAPLLILTYFGVGTLAQAMGAQRRATHSAAAIGDLVAQADSLTSAGADDIFAAASIIMSPYSTTPLSMRITSVTGDATATPKIDWSRKSGTGFTDPSNGSTWSGLPTGLITVQGENVIIAETKYIFTPPVTYILPSGLTFNETFYLRPRRVAKVVCTTC